jgi:hypothetical protein
MIPAARPKQKKEATAALLKQHKVSDPVVLVGVRGYYSKLNTNSDFMAFGAATLTALWSKQLRSPSSATTRKRPDGLASTCIAAAPSPEVQEAKDVLSCRPPNGRPSSRSLSRR